MPTVLQINVTANSGSTGKIAEQINQVARSQGWKTYLAYGRNMQPCKSELIHVGNMLQVYEHYAEYRIFDNDGLASRLATYRLIRRIERIRPDIIHLHNIHDHWLNYRILFEYLNTLSTPVVWTQHDCWSFTGGCGHFSIIGCNKWRSLCDVCPKKQYLLNHCFSEKTEKQFLLKKKLFTSTKRLTLVPVSHWLESVIKESFLKDKQIRTIYNGVDLNVFYPVDSTLVRQKYGINDTSYVIACATSWSNRKGLKDYVALSKKIDTETKILLVGLSEQQIKQVTPYGIIGIPRTENVHELAALYSGAKIVMNLSYEETFGLTTIEGFACGTPAIVYNCTASPELVTEETGIIVEPGDVDAVVMAIRELLSKGKERYSLACIAHAKQKFNKENKFTEYLNLYDELISKK